VWNGKDGYEVKYFVMDTPLILFKGLAVVGTGNFLGCHALMHCHAYSIVVKVLTHTLPSAIL
jgi:hypothetical protein